jgi:hypothetical protein
LILNRCTSTSTWCLAWAQDSCSKRWTGPVSSQWRGTSSANPKLTTWIEWWWTLLARFLNSTSHSNPSNHTFRTQTLQMHQRIGVLIFLAVGVLFTPLPILKMKFWGQKGLTYFQPLLIKRSFTPGSKLRNWLRECTTSTLDVCSSLTTWTT